MKITTMLFILLLLPSIILAEVEGTQIGADGISTYKGEPLKWDKGERDYFLMFKSLLKNSEMQTENGIPSEEAEKQNPQGDTCLESSTFQLEENHIPVDAEIDRAFLIWTGAVHPNDFNNPTDNDVTLHFSHQNSTNNGITTSELIATEKSYRIGEYSGFEFEGIIHNQTDANDFDFGYFTYRTDITNYMKNIQDLGLNKGITQKGESLFGSYTVSGLDCTDHTTYKDRSVMVSGWTLFFIYSTKGVNSKQIYIYNGLNDYSHTAGEIEVSGFEFPENPNVRASLMVSEGDPGLVDIKTSMTPESLFFKGNRGLN